MTLNWQLYNCWNSIVLDYTCYPFQFLDKKVSWKGASIWNNFRNSRLFLLKKVWLLYNSNWVTMLFKYWTTPYTIKREVLFMLISFLTSIFFFCKSMTYWKCYGWVIFYNYFCNFKLFISFNNLLIVEMQWQQRYRLLFEIFDILYVIFF